VFVADPAAAGQGPAAEEEAVSESDEAAVVAVDPGYEMFGVRELAEVAEGACYWGGFPAGADPLDDPVLRPAIRAMAARLARAEGCGWWWSDIDRSAQEFVQWAARDEPAPVLGQAADTLRNVGLEDDEREKRMNKYLRRSAGKDPHGEWWTHPFPGAISITRRVGRLGPLLLAGQEDGFGETEAVVWPLAVSDAARIFEVDSSRAWQELVSGYPGPRRPVTGTRGRGPAGTETGSRPAGPRSRGTGTGFTSPSPATSPPLAVRCLSGPRAPCSPDGIPIRPTGSPTY